MTIYDRALQTLPVTQHKIIWESYIEFVMSIGEDQFEEADEYYVKN